MLVYGGLVPLALGIGTTNTILLATTVVLVAIGLIFALKR
jgi:hypothetical protein